MTTTAESRELVLTRHIDAPRERIFEAWMKPELLAQWFAPRPLTTSVLEYDPRPGGASRIVMRTPGGDEFPNEGVFLEIVPNRRIVFTDAFGPGWVPKPDPFMVVDLTLEDGKGGTRYTAKVSHWSVEARERHEAMGFYAGWNQCLDQLVELIGATSTTP